MFHQQGDIAYIRDISWDAKNVPPTYGNLNRKRMMGSLVGGILTPLKNMKVSWDDEIPNIRKNTKCSKPPTS